MPANNMAPTAPMIDPSLESHPFQFSAAQHMSPHANGNQMGSHSHAGMANGFGQAIQQHQQQHQQQQQHQRQQQLQQQVQHQQVQRQQHQQQQQQQHAQTPRLIHERTLPSKDVNEKSIDSAYVQFILYCNPTIPLDVETDELKKGFRNPPRSDGNVFSSWTLFNLLQRLERKEIKTWAHLVIELGVEPPDKEKQQSAQKVQQYAVRLKVDSPPLPLEESK